MRSVPEWRGKTDNHMPPPKVRQRILERENHTCHLCGGKIDNKKWEPDHVPPLKDGGENREYSMKPAHVLCHRKETARQAIERAPIERMKMKASGAIKPKGGIPSRPKAEKPPGKPPLPPRRMFA